MTRDQQDLLKALAFLYLRHGQNRRALTLILLAARHAPDDVGVLRILAYAFVANEAPDDALEVIGRLELLDAGQSQDRMRRLLKARALLHAGRMSEAKATFRQYVALRRPVLDGEIPVEDGEIMPPARPAAAGSMLEAGAR